MDFEKCCIDLLRSPRLSGHSDSLFKMNLTATSATIIVALLAAIAARPSSPCKDAKSASVTIERKVYLGFDRNEYPGDAALPVLRKAFSFSGYWLTAPPRETHNTWTGKKRTLSEQGFGFALLAAGRQASRLKSGAKGNGITDAREAANSANEEGFPAGSIIFLDVEDGGRLPPQSHLYIESWVDELVRQGFKPGVYCSGMQVNDGNGRKISTADDIRSNEGARDVVFWVLNDMCPPSPGCRESVSLSQPTRSGVQYAAMWQFVRSPKERETAFACDGYASDRNCYAAADAAHRWHLDLNVASSSNPSAPR